MTTVDQTFNARLFARKLELLQEEWLVLRRIPMSESLGIKVEDRRTGDQVDPDRIFRWLLADMENAREERRWEEADRLPGRWGKS